MGDLFNTGVGVDALLGSFSLSGKRTWAAFDTSEKHEKAYCQNDFEKSFHEKSVHALLYHNPPRLTGR